MATSLSLLALALRSLLSAQTGLELSRVVIGPPHEAAKQKEHFPDENYLCIFFYRIGYAGFPADAGASEPFCLNAFCLITALGGAASSDRPTPGESELKLMGQVAECFHQHPVLTLHNPGGIEPLVQIIPSPLSLDDINHLWATQNNTPYRLSLAYEFASLPIPLVARAEHGPRVRAISLGLEPTGEGTGGVEAPEESPRRFFSPQVPAVLQVDTQPADWAPHLCLLDSAGSPRYTQVLAEGAQEVRVVLLGEPGAPLELSWEVWNSTSREWQTGVEGGTQQAGAKSLETALSEGLEVRMALPELSATGQALLRASRVLVQEGRPPRKLVSNPVLVVVEAS